MRSAVMILALLLVLGGIFALVVRDRPAVHVGDGVTTAPTTRKTVPTTTVAALDPDAGFMGPTKGVAVQSLNAKGELAREFNVDRLEPRKDGNVDVYAPVAKFYGNNGGLVTLTGSTGVVAYSQSGGRDDPSAAGSATPTSGTLRDVTIRLYDAAGDAEPSLVASVPAVRFDALDNRVATTDDVIDGRGTLAENVPVRVRGRDYEFDGYGLVMRWNDRDSRLEQLEINRGERLLVKDVSKFTGGDGESEESEAKPAKPKPTTPRAAKPTTHRAAEPPTPTPAPATRPTKQDLYRATFDRDVRISRAGVEVVRADAMNLVLALDGKARDAAPATRPAASTPTPAARKEPAHRAESTPRRATTKPASAPQPTTRAAEPVEIRWAGKLTVRPIDATPEQADEATKMIEFVGAPARVAQDGTSIEGRLIHVEPDTGRARIEAGGPVKTIELTGADGGRLRSRSPLLIDRAAGLATINGAGALTAPPAKPDAVNFAGLAAASVTWSRRLELRFGGADVESRDAQPWLSQATIEGDARIESEQLGMTGDSLVLGFDAPTAPRPTAVASADGTAMLPAPEARQLRLVTARGNARVEAGPVAQRRSLAGEELRLGFAPSDDGPALTTIDGEGRVFLIDSDGTEFAGQTLSVGMKPTALLAATSQPSGATTRPEDAFALIERLDARGDVSFKRPDGTSASGDQVQLVGDGDNRRLVLTGAPARAGGATGVVTAERLELDPRTRDVHVPVAGQLVGGDANDPAAGTGTVTWQRSMTLDATAGTCDLIGGVTIESTDARGSALNARAQAATLTFAPGALDAATSKPAGATTRSSPADSVRAIVLRDDVNVDVKGEDGRYANVQTRLLSVDVEHELITADEPGRMMMQQPARASTRPTTTAATTSASTRPAAATSLAVRWNGKLRWELNTGRLAITDRVAIGYERTARDRIQIFADRLLGTLAPIDLRAARTPDANAAPVELRAIRADGNVRVQSRLASFDAATLDYDLSSSLAYARGDAERDVVVHDSRGASGLSFGAVRWNVETGAIEDFRDIRGQLRR